MEKEKHETLLIKTSDKDKALKFRTTIIEKFPRIWTFVFNLPDGYSVGVSNVWGGLLSKDKIQLLQEFAQQEMPEEYVKDEKAEVAKNTTSASVEQLTK